jgi:hypothetical protein
VFTSHICCLTSTHSGSRALQIDLGFQSFWFKLHDATSKQLAIYPRKNLGGNWHFLVQWLLLSLATNYESSAKFNRKQ